MAYTTINKSTAHFNTKLYTGNGSTQSISGVGFQPDWTWIKKRNAAVGHRLTDAVRGATKTIFSDDAAVQATLSTALTAFASDGFSLGSETGVNNNSDTYASWNWKAGGTGSTNNDGSVASTVSVNTTAGFSIVKWTGTGSAVTVGHGLGQKPDILFVKRYTESSSWTVYTDVIDGTNDYLTLNATNAKGDSSNPVATTSVFQKSDTNGESIIAYCFASKTGYSKIGKYIGNARTDGTFVYTGFKPAFVIYKGAVGANAADNWEMVDNKRSPGNGVENVLYPNLSNAEGTGVTTRMDLLSNGFKMRTSGNDYNGSDQTYIYLAFGQSLVGSNNVPATAR